MEIVVAIDDRGPTTARRIQGPVAGGARTRARPPRNQNEAPVPISGGFGGFNAAVGGTVVGED